MRVYCDTSVINGLFADDRMIQDATKIFFKRIEKEEIQGYISDLVAQELERTSNNEKRMKLLKVLQDYTLEFLPASVESYSLANKYVQEGIIPKNYFPDALHIAIAACNKIDLLVSWNFEHMVKHRTRVEVNRINKQLGFVEMDIASPQEV